MGLDCGLSTCKWILGFFNFLIFVCGAAVLGVGIWLLVDKQSMMTILRTSDAIVDEQNMKHFNTAAVLHQAGIILIVVGSIIFLLGFLGCCGAFQESKCMLATYGTFLTIFLIAEIGVGIYAAVAKDKFTDNFKEAMVSSLKNYKSDEDAFTVSWNYIFAEFQCCGVNNYKDLDNSDWKKNNPQYTIPPACCLLTNRKDYNSGVAGCQLLAQIGASNANKGCYQAMEDWVNKHMSIIIGVAVGLGLVQLLAVIFAFCLCSALGKN